MGLLPKRKRVARRSRWSLLGRDVRRIESVAVAIEDFVWTAHALLRLDERHLSRVEIEQAIREGQDGQQSNDGQADWLIAGITASGVPFEAVYDHPVGNDETTARIVSAWRVG